MKPVRRKEIATFHHVCDFTTRHVPGWLLIVPVVDYTAVYPNNLVKFSQSNLEH